MVMKYDFEWVEKYDRSTAEVCRVEGTYRDVRLMGGEVGFSNSCGTTNIAFGGAFEKL